MHREGMFEETYYPTTKFETPKISTKLLTSDK